MDIRRRSLLSETLHGGGSSEGPINIDNYLTIEAIEDGLTASLSTNSCEYCIDGDGNWKTLSAGTKTERINSGHTLSFRGNLTPTSSDGIGIFTIPKKCNLKGNCMSMLFGDSAADNYSLEGKDYAFYKLFYGCKIVNVSSNFLPATTLASNCYIQMFYCCRSLTIAPELPATILADYCYYSMFSDCTSLTTAPSILPVTTLKYYCYTQMFSNCTSLTTAPELPATTLADYCYNSMFLNCKSLTTAPELPATTLTLSCYYRMFRGCTSLTSAPELYATILVNYCYSYMFYGCSNLNYIKMIATNIPASGCLDNWVNGVASTGTFVKNPNMTTLPTGSSGIPSGWTVINDGVKPIKPTNCLTLKPFLDKGDININFSFDFPPTSDLMVNLSVPNGLGKTTAQINFWKDVQSGLKASIGMGTSTEIQILSYEPAEDDTYIYEIIIEQ